MIRNQMVSMIGAYNDTRASLGEIVQGVRSNADSLLSSAGQLSSSSDEMASATQQIAVANQRGYGVRDHPREPLARVIPRHREARCRFPGGSPRPAQSGADSAGASQREAEEVGERIGVVASASEGVARSR